MFGDLVQGALGMLFGSAPVQSMPDEATHSEWLRLERSRLRSNGWLDWSAVPPYEHPRVWIWRPEWEGLPLEADPNKMDTQMNVWGLFWKPWRENDAPQTAETQAGSKGYRLFLEAIKRESRE